MASNSNKKISSKEKRINTEYFIGLDIGTSSVGWAVTNEKYELIKFNGKRMWGARLFNEASTSEDRRLHRSNRRRVQRRANRIRLLEEIFNDEVSKVDPEFFIRLKESKFHIEDKIVDEKNIIFRESADGDKRYYEKYPTIYHLRKKLIHSCENVDIRELYMAVHHIIKNRGHFLFKGEIEESGISLSEATIELLEGINNNLVVKKFEFNDKKINAISNLISDKDKTINDKKNVLNEIFGKEYKSHKAFLTLAVGGKVNLYDLFLEEEYKDLNELKSISFKGAEYEEVRDSYETILDSRITLIDTAKRIYDSMILISIKPEGKGLSETKVEVYEKHHMDLDLLKKVLKVKPELYNEVLRNDEKKGKNYVNYIKKSKSGTGCSREDFYKFLNKALDNLETNKDIDYIKNEINLERFLPLQRVKENSVIPYQIHMAELKKILDNASKQFEFLKDSSEGYSNIEKIIKLMEFRIPYYVGPLNDHHTAGKNGFAWVVRKKAGEVKPWNFDNLVDEEKSAEKFIENLTNKCTYLIGQDVLPKNSLLYSEFSLLNELNNIHYDGKKLPVDFKKYIVENVCKKGNKKITKKFIVDLLKAEGYSDGKGEISGMDSSIKTELKSYRDMVKIFGDKIDYQMVEDIIRWITLFGESRELLSLKIQNEYGDKIDSNKIKKICKLTYKDWGKFSREFLANIKSDTLISNDTCDGYNIIGAMRNTDNNLMQLLGKEYDFIEKINEINLRMQSDIEEVNYEILDDLYCSPAVKRGLWQTIGIVEEIKKIMGHEPKKVFVEVTRSNKFEKKPSDSRKKKLLELYKSIKDDSREWVDELKNTEDSKFNSKKLYLYYTQMGRCMYTGKVIDLDSLFTDMYDIDHIYPRSKTKNDSFENLVLVTRKANALKTDNYPIDLKIQQDRIEYWRFLHEKKLIGDKKFQRLTRTTPFTEDEMSGFIARQLVETSQASNAAAEVLKLINKDSEIVYVKAENVSDFRHDNEFVKVREINDCHHAQDAYLNIVVGNVYNEKFTKNPANFIKKGGASKYSLNKMFERDLIRNNRLVWDKSKSIETVEKMMRSNDIRVTKKVSEQRGSLYDATVYKAKDAKMESYFPLKMGDDRLNDVTKYGGYTKIKNAYYTIVKYDLERKKGIEKVIKIVPIPIYINNSVKSFDEIKEYIGESLAKKYKDKVINVEIVYKKLFINSIVELNGFRYYLGGKTNDSVCVDSASQLILDKSSKLILKKMIKRYTDKEVREDEFVNHENCKLIYDTLLTKKKSNYYANKKSNKVDEFESDEVRMKFEKLDLKEKIGVLLQILNTLTDRNTTYDLSKIGMKMSRSLISTTLSINNSFKIINQSITGLFENEIDILG